MKRNYQKELDKIIETNLLKKKVPSLLLHSCCAPCSSYCLEYLSQYFVITLLYFNPNIYPPGEYDKRVLEQKRLLQELKGDLPNFPPNAGEGDIPITLVEGRYEPADFYEAVKGLEKEPEGGSRCLICYEMRLREAAIEAKKRGVDYFTTTLTISPLKHSDTLNEIGEKLAEEYQVLHLPSDFKKKGGYQRSIELSKIHKIYRQNYCGCVFSMT